MVQVLTTLLASRRGDAIMTSPGADGRLIGFQTRLRGAVDTEHCKEGVGELLPVAFGQTKGAAKPDRLHDAPACA
jgi:hypothetical protein